MTAAAVRPYRAASVWRSSSAVEQWNHNPWVGGSNPSSATNKINYLGTFGCLFHVAGVLQAVTRNYNGLHGSAAAPCNTVATRVRASAGGVDLGDTDRRQAQGGGALGRHGGVAVVRHMKGTLPCWLEVWPTPFRRGGLGLDAREAGALSARRAGRFEKESAARDLGGCLFHDQSAIGRKQWSSRGSKLDAGTGRTYAEVGKNEAKSPASPSTAISRQPVRLADRRAALCGLLLGFGFDMPRLKSQPIAPAGASLGRVRATHRALAARTRHQSACCAPYISATPAAPRSAIISASTSATRIQQTMKHQAITRSDLSGRGALALRVAAPTAAGRDQPGDVACGDRSCTEFEPGLGTAPDMQCLHRPLSGKCGN